MADESSRSNPSGNEVLFGGSADEGIVAVEPDPHHGVRIYRRTANGVSVTSESFLPWMLLRQPPDRDLAPVNVIELEGTGQRYLMEFASQREFQHARSRVRDLHLEHLAYPGTRAVLTRSGQTLFKGMKFDQIVRMQFDIETNGLDPIPLDNRIFMIAISDNRGMVKVLEGDEKELLERFVSEFITCDPDVIEGHNVFGFDLPFVIARARRRGVALPLGRDGSEPWFGRSRNYAIGGASRPFVPVVISGRHVLDTYLIVQRFDWSKGSLSSYGLKACARQFGFAHENRVELPGSQIYEIYGKDRALVAEYARQDVVETRLLADLITPVEFYQTQMVPDNYGNAAVTGSGEKINSLFIRAYLAAGSAVPISEASQPFPGGYTEVRRTGVVKSVVKADVESLYPSLMLTHRIAPRRDVLNVFLPALKDLTDRRIAAKREAASAETADAEQYWDGLQSSFKVLINSFYGYLAGPFPWNDYLAARRVTELGRELVVSVSNRIDQDGGSVIEIDTDGLYFVPPEKLVGAGEAAEREYVAAIGSALPTGIRLAFDGRYARMLSVKTKNYVLETYEGKRILKGSSLRSRADERFGRAFLERSVDLLLQEDFQGVADLYSGLVDQLKDHRVSLEDLLRRERVTEKTFHSVQKRRSARVAEGVAIGDYVMVFEKANGELGLAAEYQKPGDENTRHYLDKLYRFARRLEDAFGGSFDRWIPRPGSETSSGQGSLDLLFE